MYSQPYTGKSGSYATRALDDLIDVKIIHRRAINTC